MNVPALEDLTQLDEARVLLREGSCPRSRSLVLQPLREFARRYFTLRGYRDGLHGLVLCMLMAYYTFVAYWRARRIWTLEVQGCCKVP